MKGANTEVELAIMSAPRTMRKRTIGSSQRLFFEEK